MTKEINDGGPAYPHGNREVGGHPGMSLRDYFAGRFCRYFLTLGEPTAIWNSAIEDDDGWANTDGAKRDAGIAARASYFMADAMLAARGKEDTESRLIVDLRDGDIRAGVEYYNRIDASVYSIAGQYNDGSFQLTRGDGIQRKATGSELEDKKRWLRIIPTKESAQ